MPKDGQSNPASKSRSHDPYPQPLSARMRNEMPNGRIEVFRTSGGMHSIPSSGPAAELSSMSSATTHHPQPYPPHAEYLDHNLSDPWAWNNCLPPACNGAIEGSTTSLQSSTVLGLTFMTPVGPRPERHDRHRVIGRAVEPWLYDTQHPPAISSVQPQTPSQASSSQTSLPSVSMLQAASAPHHSESFFQGAHDFRMERFQYFNAPNATLNIQLPPQDQALDENQSSYQYDVGRLHPLPKPSDTSGTRPEYLDGSRKREIDESLKWILSPTELLLCVHGPAGIGKSTFVGRLSESLRTGDQLAACIFLGAIPTLDSLGPETVIKMAAHEIGNIHPRAIPKIVEAMSKCHATSLETHLEGYILEPLRSLRRPHPLVVIVDAIDEWRDHAAFIKVLASLNAESSVVKFIVTSRLDPRTARLPNIDKISLRTFSLRPVSSDIMKSYFLKYLEIVPWGVGRKASITDVNKLVHLSDGLLVWASIVISLLSQPFSESPPHEILAGILSSERQVGGSEGLAELYGNALLRLFPSAEPQKYFRLYFGAALVLQEPLSISDFSSLAGIPAHVVRNIHSTLSALQTHSPSGSEGTVYPASTRFHLSFLEYVRNTPLSTAEHSFMISTFDSHSALGLTCLKIVSGIASLAAWQAGSDSFPLHGTQSYAVKHWPLHVSYGSHRSDDQWLNTPHCSMLQAFPAVVRQRWSTAFLNLLLPREESENTGMEGQDMTSILLTIGSRLRGNGGDLWVFRVACLEVAVRLGNVHAEAWFRLGLCYFEMGDRTGSLSMYEEAIRVLRRALELQPPFDPDRTSSLIQLAISLGSLHECNGDINFLNEAISQLRDALPLLPEAHPNWYPLLNNLAKALLLLYHHNHDTSLLGEAISHSRDVLARLPVAHPDRSYSLCHLATVLHYFYERKSDINALNEAIRHLRDALALLPVAHPNHSFVLNGLGPALHSLYECNGDINVLSEGISHLRDMLALLPIAHPRRSLPLDNLSRALQSQFESNGEIEILDEAILLRHELLILHPPGHRYRTYYAERLVELLGMRVGVTGEAKDQERNSRFAARTWTDEI